MCLTIDKSQHLRIFGICIPKKAKQDITVFKELKHSEYGIVTPCILYPVSFKNGITTLSAEFNVTSNNVLRRYRYYQVYEGIHSCAELTNSMCFEGKYRYHYAIIPKGTKYFIGESNDLVSTKLIIFDTRQDYLNYINNTTHGKSCEKERQC